jgi:DNA-binding XRE family transcriptional regulator
MKDKELEKVGKEVAKKKRPKRSEQMSVQTNPGENTKYLNHNLQLSLLPAIDTADEKQVASRIVEYFQICGENDMKPSMAGLALAIGVSRQTLWNWSTGETRGNEHLDLIKKAVQMLDAQMVDYMQNGKINPVAGIFLMKNSFGYKDQQEVVVKPEAPLGEKRDVDALREQYIESIPEELPPEGSI